MTALDPSPLATLIRQRIERADGWLPFDQFMTMALYEPGLGYYANASPKFGLMPEGGSDFVTAPELSPLFGQALARQVAQALDGSASAAVWEFGAGSGALAEHLLDALGERAASYTIVDVSGSLRERQAQRLARFGDKVRWASRLPEQMTGVVVGNEVLDAMPVQLLHWDGSQWFERGVGATPLGFAWIDRPTKLRPPVQGGFVPGSVIEIHHQAEAFVRTLGEHLSRGAVFLLDYGFPEAEFYHPQRLGGTLMCHRAHQSDMDPLSDVGLKDITAHINFTGIAVAAQEAGLEVLGYTSQGRFLLNCGVLDMLPDADYRAISNVQKLLAEHEMGELFKVIGLARGIELDALGFAQGDRTHRL